MYKIGKSLLGATAGLALGFGVLGATPAAAYTGPAQSDNYWVCTNYNLTGTCAYGPAKLEGAGKGNLAPAYNDKVSSLHTNEYGIITYSDWDFKGTVGHFSANWRWDQLNAPYNDTITSMKNM
ncbi:hypothetical protein ACWCPM_31750 [Streptomyces sp. NPDC002309]